MQIDFYQLSRDPVERVVPLLAARALEGGARLLVVSTDAAQRAALAQALWQRDGAFLANGEAGGAHDARQPVLLAESCAAPHNGSQLVLIADGRWRDEAARFERALLLFGPEQTAAARKLWAELAQHGQALRIFKQDEQGGWKEGR